MFYSSDDSRVLIGNAAIPKEFISQYIATLCFSVKDDFSGQKFVDISLTQKQLQDLRDLISWYLDYSSKYSPSEQRDLSPSLSDLLQASAALQSAGYDPNL